jgi:Domain of unknown function (DUF397)
MDTWRKSTYSDANGNACIEVATAPHGVAVRDTTNRAGAILSVPPAAWTAFLATIR